MGEVVKLQHYRTARLLLTSLRDGAEEHVFNMAALMAGRRNAQGEAFWRGTAAAIADLRRKDRGHAA